MDANSATFGEALRAGRIRAGLTQAELAGRAGVSVRAVRYIEQGRVTRPRRESLRRLAEAVGLVLDGQWPAGDRGADLLCIGVLGRLELRRGTQPVEMGPLKQRCLLALLALQPNRVVHREEIIDMLWGAHPPDSCHNLVHTYVSRLRKVAGLSRPGTGLITSARGGYRLAVETDQLDLLRFDELTARAAEARQHFADPEATLALYEEALGLWRGPAVADLPEEVRHHPAATAVTGRRLAAALAHADTALDLGRHEPVVEQLRPLVHTEPLHEGLHARLMLGLAGSGQQAAALRLFADIRTRLAEDLGIEPGPEIGAAYLRIIRSDVPAVAARPGPGHAQRAHPTPAQLPADTGGFTGRDEHIDRLDEVLRRRESEGGNAVTITAITGTAGVGKTALAVHWAHRVRDRFPDGQLYVNLRGYASDSPVRPLEALTRFLHALGLPSERVPVDEEEAVGLYRTHLADRRALILLDNASGADQVRPLLPGTPGCLVLVTSRDRLAGLTATEGAHRITLDVLEPEDAQQLLARMIGDARPDAEPGAVADLAEACAYLPLALRIVAANLASLPHTTITDYTDELRKRGRLAELVVEGDEQGAVRAAFDLSYEMLDPEARQLFRVLGVHSGPDFTADAATALTAGGVVATRRLLGQLAGAHLVTEHAAGRYQFHDLLREYAADRAHDEDGAERINAAIGRLLDHYLHTTDAAGRLLYPHVLRMPLPSPGHLINPPATGADAIEWLDGELANLIAAARGAKPALQRYSWLIADALRGYFVARGHGSEGVVVCQAALAAAERAGDDRAKASVNDILGLIHYNLSDYPKAIDYHCTALTLNRRTGNAAGEASSLHNLGRVHSQLGKPATASLYYEQSLTINRRIGNRYGEATDLTYIGASWLSRGRPDRALTHHTQALANIEARDKGTLEATAYSGIGTAHWALGQLGDAARYHHDSLLIFRRIGHRLGEASVLVCLAETNCDAGRYQEASVQAHRCVLLGRQLGERRPEVGGLEVLATVYLRRGHHEAAVRYYMEALQVARRIGFGYGETSVLIGLSAALRVRGRISEAVAQCRAAIAVMHDSGMRLLEGRAVTELAHCYLALGNLGQAAAHADRAVKVVRERRQRLIEARALRVRGLIAEAAGDLTGARSTWVAAMDIFSDIGTPEADEVRELLSGPRP
ncbi:MAG TPA: BTAD domain-containing putative transcriptional regulator [Actinophytocola sp.]|uniref:BTAD domain-containing putative transcriptional regulator n=1 Tax=Actinophytocola sp. TaxID=1872138 RepID=UPI002DBCE70F|nr:BTAD domain-containing putative transcriptional regulator [Actinophytocola sp.]HEU5471450.1 BTAD domain-containing putative transcriptional regulator [Actinophytocola sp.]